jgi:hypothetical protein
MKILTALLILFYGALVELNAQDILYTTSGAKLKSKILEINTDEIKYKSFSNSEGPTYVISKSEIIFIQYANGMSEILNYNPKTFEPKKINSTTTLSPKNKLTPKVKTSNLRYMNTHLISINALALANGDATIIYDHELFKSKLAISVLGSINFNSRMNALNMYINETKVNAKKNYDVGFGINYLPNNHKKIQYFIGFLGKYMTYNYKEVIDTSNNQKRFADASANQIALMITNGWLFRISPFFNFKIFASIGKQINSTSLEMIDKNGEKTNFSHSPKMYLGYCFGYRF